MAGNVMCDNDGVWHEPRPIKIIGEDIYYKGVKVAEITPGKGNLTLIDQFKEKYLT